MEKIASFTVDHIKLQPGIYVSRKDTVGDGILTTFDVRMKEPNREMVMDTSVMHTIEHLMATFFRAHPVWADKTIYVGPMGCLTGFYLLTTGLTPAEALDLTRSAFAWMAEYEGEIPGASAVECGNYLMMDPVAARLECKAMSEVLQKLDADHMRYQEK